MQKTELYLKRQAACPGIVVVAKEYRKELYIGLLCLGNKNKYYILIEEM
jgi:hypothetical protein